MTKQPLSLWAVRGMFAGLLVIVLYGTAQWLFPGFDEFSLLLVLAGFPVVLLIPVPFVGVLVNFTVFGLLVGHVRNVQIDARTPPDAR